MKVVKYDRRSGKMKLLIQSIDDLWHLYNIIDKDDRISGLTYRREEARPDKLRAERGEKKRMRLTIDVKDIEFHEFSDRLRVHGIITEGYQDIGSYHTFNLSIGDIIDITKIWGDYHLQRIEDAVDATKQPLITFIAMEDGDATFAQLRQYGVEEIAHITAHTPGKQYPSKKDEKKDFYKEVLNKLEAILNGLLILLGPGFAKEEFLDFGKSRNPDLFTNCYVAAAGNAGMTGIQEVLKKGIGSEALEKSRVAYETQIIERLLEEISKEGAYSYGFDEVKDSLKAGAVEILLVVDALLRKKMIEDILDLANRTRCKVVIISEVHEAGKKLSALGGVAALLRYKRH